MKILALGLYISPKSQFSFSNCVVMIYMASCRHSRAIFYVSNPCGLSPPGTTPRAEHIIVSPAL